MIRERVLEALHAHLETLLACAANHDQDGAEAAGQRLDGVLVNATPEETQAWLDRRFGTLEDG